MELYLWWIIIGIVFVIFEFFSPTLFFLNFGLACFITSVFVYLGFSQLIQAIVFLLSSGLLLLLVRPVLKKFYKKSSDLEDKYIGQTVKVTKRIDDFSGRITIYGEDWEARSANSGEVFEAESNVKIVKRDSLILYVENL